MAGLTWVSLIEGKSGDHQESGQEFRLMQPLIRDNPYLLYANNYGGGVFRSTDGAETWEDWGKGYSGAEIHKGVCIPASNTSTVYAIGRKGPLAEF